MEKDTLREETSEYKKYLLDIKEKLKEINSENNSNKIAIGDIVSGELLTFSYIDDSIISRENIRFKLVNESINYNMNPITEVQINSPLGRGVIDKLIGDSCQYSINGVTFMFLIKNVVKTSELEESFTRS